MDSPWGASQHVDQVAPGITSVSTESHGGYHLDPVAMSAVHARFPNFQTFAGGPWFEEDCDWAIVALTFPELFDNENLRAAVRTVNRQCQTAGERKDGKSQIKFSAYDNGWLSVGAWLLQSHDGQNLVTRSQLPQPPAFREEDCSGVFDGVGSVFSDADPGL